jgi:hypothetical protein
MLKAIETRYKGYRFRSRLEARWAVFFDTLGIKWEYEVEGFELKDAGRYLPDFWLPDFWSVNDGLWVEIKPRDPSFNDELSAQHKMMCLIEESKGTGYIFRGQPIDEDGTYYFFNTKHQCAKEGTHDSGEPWNTAFHSFTIHHAYRAARSARFEHGEQP